MKTNQFPRALIAAAVPPRAKPTSPPFPDVVFLEIGDRSTGDAVSYPDDDVVGFSAPDGKWQYTKKDGTSY